MPYDDDSMILYRDDFESRARGEEKAPPGKTVYPVEPRQGSWTGNVQLGRSVQFAPDANNRQTVLKLDEWGMPQIWTIMLGINDNSLTDDLLGGRLSAIAELDIGVGGASQKVIVDWKQGTVISAPMNSVNVIAQYDTSQGTPGDLEVFMTVTISRGTHPTGVGPTLTKSLSGSNLGSFNDVLVDIPAFATHLQGYRFDLLSNDPLVAANNIHFFGVAGSATPIAVIPADELHSFGPAGIPIPNGAKFVILESANVTTMPTIFTLGGL